MTITVKQELILGVASLAIIMILLIFYVFQYSQQASQLSNISTTNTISTDILLNQSEISKHNQSQDCWIIIENKVYDVTKFLSRHPGGSGFISPYCGQDATTPFLTQGGRGKHSQTAFKILGLIYLGDFNSTVTNQPDANAVNTLQIDDD